MPRQNDGKHHPHSTASGHDAVCLTELDVADGREWMMTPPSNACRLDGPDITLCKLLWAVARFARIQGCMSTAGDAVRGRCLQRSFMSILYYNPMPDSCHNITTSHSYLVRRHGAASVLRLSSYRAVRPRQCQVCNLSGGRHLQKYHVQSALRRVDCAVARRIAGAAAER